MNNFYNYPYYVDPTKNMTNKNADDTFLYNPQKPNKPMNPTGSGLYNPYQGLIRGNLFSGLYDPYLSTEPYDIKPINKQAEMLTNLDSLSFAMIDLNLYLDIYPEDRQMIELYNQYRKHKIELQKKYEKEYGPLCKDSDSLEMVPWAWDNRPWPWQ